MQKALIHFFSTNPWCEYAPGFYFVLTVLIILFIWLIIKQRLQNAAKKYAALEKQLTKRTTELDIIIEEISRSNKSLREISEANNCLTSMAFHDIRSSIRFISTISSYLEVHNNKMPAEGFAQIVLQLKTGAKRLEDFTENFFFWANTQRDNFKTDLCHFSVNDLFVDVTSLYQDLTSINSNTIVVTPTSLVCYTDYQILSFILRNLLDNANKYTTNGTVTLTANNDCQHIFITVSDTGQGLSPGQIDNFLDENKLTTTGTGSLLILSMLKKIGARLEITTQPGKGSAFKILLEYSQPYP